MLPTTHTNARRTAIIHRFYFLPTEFTPGDMSQEIYEQKLKQNTMLDSKVDKLVVTRKQLSPDMLPKGLWFSASGFYPTHRMVMCIWSQQTSDQVDGNITRSSLINLQRTWSHWGTGNTPEVTELLRGDGGTQATQRHSTVCTLGVTLVLPDHRRGWSENWGFFALTQGFQED